jgi:hypothetical protein
MNQSYLKCSIDGVNGSGKSGTSARLAVGISKELCNSAPVLAFDSEERWRFYKPTIFDAEKVPLIVISGTSLKALQKALATAEAEGCCVFVGDQLTTPWMEGIKAFAYENGNLPFDRRQQLMNEWDVIVRKFRYGPFHAICCGRLGYHWENIEDEDGNLKLIQGDSKFNAGGGSNFGYEADLELEIRRRKRRVLPSLKNLLTRKLEVEHVCEVVKDAAAGILNGKQFVFPTSEGQYKPGDYKPVLKALRPYLDFMATISPPQPAQSSSKDLIVSGKTAWAQDMSDRKHLLEELDATLTFCFPGGEKMSKLHSMFRNLTLEHLNGYISWSRMEDEAETEHIERNVLIVKALRKRLEGGEKATDHNSLVGLLYLATEDVLHPGNGKTLIEVMTMPKKPQAIVEVLDRKVSDEMDVAGD